MAKLGKLGRKPWNEIAHQLLRLADLREECFGPPCGFAVRRRGAEFPFDLSNLRSDLRKYLEPFTIGRFQEFNTAPEVTNAAPDRIAAKFVGEAILDGVEVS